MTVTCLTHMMNQGKAKRISESQIPGFLLQTPLLFHWNSCKTDHLLRTLIISQLTSSSPFLLTQKRQRTSPLLISSWHGPQELQAAQVFLNCLKTAFLPFGSQWPTKVGKWVVGLWVAWAEDTYVTSYTISSRVCAPLPSRVLINFISVAQSCPTLRPHGLQHTRLPGPSPTPGACSNSCPLSRWCHPTISSSVIPFSSCLQSFPASGSFPMSQFFASGGQSTGVSASTSDLSMNTQDWSPLEWTSWIPLQSKGLSRVFSNTTVQFFGAQLSL